MGTVLNLKDLHTSRQVSKLRPETLKSLNIQCVKSDCTEIWTQIGTLHILTLAQIYINFGTECKETTCYSNVQKNHTGKSIYT